MENLDDIVFAKRNKQYGAYLLRTSYGNVVKKATILGVTFFSLALATPLLWALRKTNEQVYVEANLSKVKLPPPPPEEPKILEPPKPVEPIAPVKTIKFNQIEILPDEKVIDELPPTQEELANTKAVIGSANIEGEIGDAPPVESEPTPPIIEPPVTIEKAEDPFTAAEVMPEFQGGLGALGKFLQKNLRYPTQAQSAGIGGKVYVQFIVGRDGSISHTEVMRGIGFGCDEEALRVIKLMPKWLPGKQSGRSVPVRFTLPISFLMQE